MADKTEKKPGFVARAKAAVKNFFGKCAKFFRDTKSELKKVVWPSKEDTKQNTVVVLVTVALAAVVMILLDTVFGGDLAQAVRALGGFDLILCGKQTTDGDTAQVGPEISEWLNIPSVADVVKINQINEDGITVSMDLPEEVEVAKVQFPCLLAVDKDIFQPRLPSYVRKMNTKDREIRILSLADMDDKDAMHYGLNGSPTQVQRIFPPAVNDKKEMWDGSGEELADRLYQKIVDMKFV